MLIESDIVRESWDDIERVYKNIGVAKRRDYQGKWGLSGKVDFGNASYWINVKESDREKVNCDYGARFVDMQSNEEVGKCNGFDNGFYIKFTGKIGESKVTFLLLKFKKKDLSYFWRVYVLCEENGVKEVEDDDIPFSAPKDAPKTKLGNNESVPY